MVLELTSQAFENGDRIPEQYGYTAENMNPPLSIAGHPAGTESLALVVDDPDAMEPAGKIWDHWVLWNIEPDREQIPADWDVASATEGRNDYGEPGYGGPNPPDREHTYRFRVFALDTTLDLAPGATKADLESAMEGHVIEEALLEGTYAP
ncbi:MAG: YbhB/YbcL family Raf kinase inhibitor-like protein [Halodesulfurarchaeum sp.]|nr:YbhB/YbcL family Raf kinase inhibitor-like protein [Halodesulfurarchaeum sp.]